MLSGYGKTQKTVSEILGLVGRLEQTREIRRLQ